MSPFQGAEITELCYHPPVIMVYKKMLIAGLKLALSYRQTDSNCSGLGCDPVFYIYGICTTVDSIPAVLQREKEDIDMSSFRVSLARHCFS